MGDGCLAILGVLLPPDSHFNDPRFRRRLTHQLGLLHLQLLPRSDSPLFFTSTAFLFAQPSATRSSLPSESS